MNFKSLYSDVINNLPLQKQQWLKEKMQEISLSKDIAETLFTANAMARRKVGISILNSTKFQMDQAVRIVLLLQALKYFGDNSSRLITQAYSIGDTNEKVAIVKGLSILQYEGFGNNNTLKDIALLARQASNEELFCALALDNAYPAARFDQSEFNNMMLKALHLELDLKYVIALEDRNNSALQSLALDLCKERKNAQRSFPTSIEMVVKIKSIKGGWP